MVISNSWWIYINSLIHRNEDGMIVDIDYIRYVDAYNRFFSFLSELDDFYQFTNFFESLLKTFMKMENVNLSGITKFINSFCIKVKERRNILQLLELQILLTFLRGSVKPSELFNLSIEILENIIFKLDPNKRALFLYIFIENVNIKYQIVENSQDFIQEINKLIGNRLSGYLKEEFNKLSRISINERTFVTILEDLEGLITYLNDIGEASWIIIMVRNIYSKILEFESFGDPIKYVRKYIDFAVSRNRFEVVYEIYDFLEDIFMYQTDLGYDTFLIDLWIEAGKKFVDKKEELFLQNSLNKLNVHLKNPRSNTQIFHYFFVSDLLWKLKSRFFSLDQQEFWNMIFYRALFEEKDLELAQLIFEYLNPDLQSTITDLAGLQQQAEILRSQIEITDTTPEIEFNHSIKQMILRIKNNGEIAFRMLTTENLIIEQKVLDEFWNDVQLLEIFNDLFSGDKEKNYKFNLIQFGKIVYLFIPRLIRTILRNSIKQSTEIIPELYFVFNTMTIPFELVYLDGFLMLKNACSYKIGEIPLSGIPFESPTPLLEQTQGLYNILIIEAHNSRSPLKWNDQTKQNELIFPFTAGNDELNHVMNYFNRPEVNAMEILSDFKSNRENILTHLSQGAYHIVHFVGNIFYSKWSPKDSFILANDNNIITFDEIQQAINQNPYDLTPFLFFNVQVYDVQGERLKNTVSKFGEIVANFDFERVSGVMSRNYPIFNDETRIIYNNFYSYLLTGYDQGTALLKARQQSKNFLAISSFIIFGKAWSKL